MPCNSCVKIRPLPECLQANETMTLDGIDFGSETVATVMLTDKATGRNTIFEDLEITEAFPLMNHTYELQFFNEAMEQIPFTIDADVTGCCLEFDILESMVFAGGNWTVTSTECTTA